MEVSPDNFEKILRKTILREARQAVLAYQGSMRELGLDEPTQGMKDNFLVMLHMLISTNEPRLAEIEECEVAGEWKKLGRIYQYIDRNFLRGLWVMPRDFLPKTWRSYQLMRRIPDIFLFF